MHNYDAWKVNPDDFYKETTIEGKLKFLVRFGVLAPSSHNSQPWSFKVEKNHLHVLPNETRRLAVSDKKNRQLWISIGCAVQNIMIAADYYGLDYEITINAVQGIGGHEILFTFRENNFSNSERTPSHLILFIAKRHTNRNPYEARLPDHKFIEQLTLRGISDLRVDFISDRERKNQIADLVLAAMETAMMNREFRAELSGYVKPNHTRSFLGMPGFTLDMPAPVALIAPFLLQKCNLAKLTKRKDEKLLKEGTPVFGIISTRGDKISDWINAGRAYEHIALEAERAGLATAIMAAAIEVGEYYKDLKKILAIELRPQVFFRMGFAKKAALPSPRLPEEKVLR